MPGIELKNCYLHVRWKNEKQDIQSGKQDIQSGKQDIQIPDYVSNKTKLIYPMKGKGNGKYLFKRSSQLEI